MSTEPEKWSHSEGERPNTVTVAERRHGSPVYVKMWDPHGNGGDGKYVRRSLKFKVRDEDGDLIPEAVENAETYAMEQALKLKKGRQELTTEKPTLSRICSLYLKYRSPRKSEREQKADRRRVEMWCRVLGGGSDPHEISLHLWEQFIDDRTSGALDARGRRVPETRTCNNCSADGCAECNGEGKIRPRRPVGATTVAEDCKWLRYLFNWATDVKIEGARLMSEHPITKRFKDKVPTEKNPRRPTATWERYEAIREVTDDHTMEIRWNGKREPSRSYLSEILDLAVATGRRLSAIRQLTYADLRLERTDGAPHGAIRWPAETDKAGTEGTIPLNELGREAVDRVLRERPEVGDAPLFPAPSDPAEPVSRHLCDTWLRKAEEMAGVEPQEGTLWHAYRRMWVTARKDLPAKDVAEAGGWADTQMVERVYTQADKSTTLSVVMHEGRVRGTA